MLLRRFVAIMLFITAAIAHQSAAAESAPGASEQRFEVPNSISPEAAALMKGVFAASKTWFVEAAKVTDPKTVEAMALALPKTPDSEIAKTAAKYGVAARLDVLGGVPVVRIHGLTKARSRGTIVSMHGGGYISGSAKSIGPTDAQLARNGFEIITIDYTLAPRAKWQQITDQVVAVWRALLASGVKPRSVAFAGGSAGGGLAAGSLLKARDEGLPMPAALVLMSPWADISMTGDTYTTLADYEPLFPPSWLPMAAGLYAAPADQKNPYVSPVYGDYGKAFPPTLIQGGTHEILLSNFVREYQAIRKGGHEAVLDLYEGMPHCFQDLIADAPEARTARQRIVEFVEGHVKP